MFFTKSTFAGAGGVGEADGPAATATFARPIEITVSSSGVVYISEPGFNGLRKIEAGTVSTLASRTLGFADGPLSTALFQEVAGIAIDQAGNLYLADSLNHRIRKVDTLGNVTTIAAPNNVSTIAASGPVIFQGWADGPRDGVLFNYPAGIAIDAADGTLYVTETHRIRRISLSDGFVNTVAAVGIAGFADGSATIAQFSQPSGLVVTQTGDLFVADTNNYRIRRVSPSGTVTTAAGDGVPAVPTDKPQFADNRPALNARFEAVADLAIDRTGTVWVADGTHVRMYSPITNTVSTACSDQGTHQQPIEFDDAVGIAVFTDGTILVVDNGANIIFRLTPHPD